jgi:nitrogen-specific signal transduction histidine kinase
LAPTPVLLDAEKFEQALLNLAINALEAMPKGGEIFVGTALALSGDAVELEVSDTGSGIEPRIRDDLFKPFVTTKRRGSGLGLALPEKVISQHHGKIDYRTGPDGTSFFIVLPLLPTKDSQP